MRGEGVVFRRRIMRHGLVMIENSVGRQRQIIETDVRLYEKRGWVVAAEQPPNSSGRPAVRAPKPKPRRKPKQATVTTTPTADINETATTSG
jgi:hypothetical protein